jgi:hypothetical protein
LDVAGFNSAFDVFHQKQKGLELRPPESVGKIALGLSENTVEFR